MTLILDHICNDKAKQISFAEFTKNIPSQNLTSDQPSI